MLSKDKIIVFFRITGDFYKEFEFDMNKGELYTYCPRINYLYKNSLKTL